MIVVIATAVVSNFYILKRTEIREKQHFLASNWEFIFENWEKRRIFWIGNGAEYQTLVIGRIGPGNFSFFSYLFFKINLFKKLYQEHYQRVKLFGTRSGHASCRS